MKTMSCLVWWDIPGLGLNRTCGPTITAAQDTSSNLASYPESDLRMSAIITDRVLSYEYINRIDSVGRERSYKRCLYWADPDAYSRPSQLDSLSGVAGSISPHVLAPVFLL